jgi:hypothetical protein
MEKPSCISYTCNTAGATCGAWTAYHFGEPEYTPLPYLSWKELHVYLNTINTTGATCGAGTAYHFGEAEYTPTPLSFMERTVMYILTRLTRRVSHVEQELLIISENLSILPFPYLSWKELHAYFNTINTMDVTCGVGISYLSGGKYLRTCTKFVSLYIPLKI